MNTQTGIALLIVAAAAAYLGYNLILSARNFFSKKSSGCASGCGKCSFAPKELKANRPGLIPLTDIRSLPKDK